MPGTKQHSGGLREGAGRKPASWRVKLGDVFAVREREGDGVTPLEKCEVVEVTRSRVTLRLKGREIIIIR